MVSEETLKKVVSAVGEQVGASIGNLLVITTLQTRALIVLANAIKNDPNVSEETRLHASSSMKTIDLLIENLEVMAGQNSQETIRELLGMIDER
ncbi:hypothetical protein HX810_20965 [Pseudomonas salomonii]|uniref:Uncharacterized protein n=1 Tax=Pseudomonas salomonii TaxID=191391 RepID=A0A7Y8KPL7_9PSED|nr:hypothetical protein [Pseudomonas salomonii]NWF10149.1 hypothetical protein [Pseudomonas salomonii]